MRLFIVHFVCLWTLLALSFKIFAPEKHISSNTSTKIANEAPRPRPSLLHDPFRLGILIGAKTAVKGRRQFLNIVIPNISRSLQTDSRQTMDLHGCHFDTVGAGGVEGGRCRNRRPPGPATDNL
jgi:hypothetical protein